MDPKHYDPPSTEELIVDFLLLMLAIPFLLILFGLGKLFGLKILE